MTTTTLVPNQEALVRLRTVGVDALAPRELLALILAGVDDASPVQLADALLQSFPSVPALARARHEEVARVPGISPEHAAAIVAAFQLVRLAADTETDDVPIDSPQDVAAVAWPRLTQRTRERLLLLVCDVGSQLRHVETVVTGGIDRCLVSPRDILNAVLRHDGSRFAIAHNHPGGDPTPSDADVECTIELAAAAEVVGLRLLFHVVIADSAWQAVDPGLYDRWWHDRELVADVGIRLPGRAPRLPRPR